MELSSLVLWKHESRRRPGIAKAREMAPSLAALFPSQMLTDTNNYSPSPPAFFQE